MKHVFYISGFAILVSAFYWYVSLWVPQKRTEPPEDIAIAANLSTEEMVAVGEEIVAGKGTCLTCHTMGNHGGASLRFPDLGNIGAVAGGRVEGQDDVTYLAASMYDPNSYVVPGFVAGMPNAARPPIALTDNEILTVIAYLQSLGGTPSVTMSTELEWQGQNESAAPAAPVAAGGNRDAETLFTAYLCNTCHSLDGIDGAGPSLQGLGSRLTSAEIYESIMEPDKTITEGFAPMVMGTMLDATGFYEQVSSQELRTLVDYLASL